MLPSYNWQFLSLCMYNSLMTVTLTGVYFLQVKINDDIHEFILYSGTVASSKDWQIPRSILIPNLFSFFKCWLLKDSKVVITTVGS
jgi:hypothetical protein